MQDSGTKWAGSRDGEYATLLRLVSEQVPFIHIHGCHGSGKSTIAKDVLADQDYALVDCSLATTLTSVMTCIIRRIAKGKRIASVLESFDMDDEVLKRPSVKSSPPVKSEPSPPSPTATPGFRKFPPPIQELIRTEPRPRRVGPTASPNVAPGVKSGNLRKKRKAVEDDDLSAVEDSNSSDDDDNHSVDGKGHRWRTTPGLYHARSEMGFLSKLERLVLRSSSVKEEAPLFLLLENVDVMMRIEPDTACLLHILSRLDEYLQVGRKICLLTTSVELMPLEISSRAVTVHLHALTVGETARAISPYVRAAAIELYGQDVYSKRACPVPPKFLTGYPVLSLTEIDTFVSTLCSLLYASQRNNFVLLRDTVVGLFVSGLKNKTVAGEGSSKLLVTAKSHATKILQNTDCGFKSEGSSQVQFKWLSKLAQKVLVAGYLAAHNPAKQDKHIFKAVGHGTANKRTQSVTHFRKARTLADNIDIRAPVPFQIGRLLKIYRHLTGNQSEEDRFDGGFAFYKTVRELTHFGLFRTGGSVDDSTWVRYGSLGRLNCHAPFELIEEVAREIDVKLDEVLYA